ncbi:MAG: gluconokinase [Rhizobiales bacterium]|nr:gluconokinase [Hyphomicrobiales bacterium]
MGVAGSGKTTVGELLAGKLGWPFRDADSFHPPANVAKMSSGVPLVDEDRWPWLDAIGAALKAAGDAGAAGRPVTFIFLDGPRALLAERIGGRKGHFMPPSLLDSQLATLERPTPDEGVLVASIEPPPDDIVAALLAEVSPASR